MFVDAVDSRWREAADLRELADISGPWAVALWDPARSEHLLVGDPLGVQPLFWALGREGLIVAGSWLAPIVDRTDVPDTPDYEGFLIDQGPPAWGSTMVTRTPFSAVSRVPGGWALRIRPDGSTRYERFWDPRDLPGPDGSLSFKDCAEMLREAVDSAVRRLTVGAQPFGAHVSGGLDCTAVACRANQVLRESGRSLVAGYSWAPSIETLPLADQDERRLIADVAESEGFPVRLLSGREDGDWYSKSDPLRYPVSTHDLEVLALSGAKADGVGVMMSGWGGDELASLNPTGILQGLIRSGRIATVARETALLAEVRDGRTPTLRRRGRAMAGATLAALPGGRNFVGQSRAERARRDERRAYESALRARSPLAAEIAQESLPLVERVTDHHEQQLNLIANGHLQHRTRWWYQTGRLMGIEYRYPLLDLHVVETALRLPWWAYLSQGWTRVAYRAAISPWVPDTVAWNSQNTEPALHRSLRRNAPTSEARRRPGELQDTAHAEVMRLLNLVWDEATEQPAYDDRVTSRVAYAIRV